MTCTSGQMSPGRELVTREVKEVVQHSAPGIEGVIGDRISSTNDLHCILFKSKICESQLMDNHDHVAMIITCRFQSTTEPKANETDCSVERKRTDKKY